MPKKVVKYIRVFVDDPHPTSGAAAVLLRRQLKRLDATCMSRHDWCKYRDGVVKKVIEAKISLTCEFCGRGNLIPFTERYCEDMLTLDHFIPHSKSKNNAMSNLVLCCHRCNCLKSDRLPTDEERKNIRSIQFLLDSAGQTQTV